MINIVTIETGVVKEWYNHSVNPETNWKVEYRKEIDHAVSARANENEGKARVCARRAAGIVIGEYLYRRGYTNLNRSIYDRMSILNSLPDLDSHCKEVAGYLLLKVDQDHNLPVAVDLIGEVEWLAHSLLLES